MAWQSLTVWQTLGMRLWTFCCCLRAWCCQKQKWLHKIDLFRSPMHSRPVRHVMIASARLVKKASGFFAPQPPFC
eukprot:5802018-Amphidinium_carterae.1